MVVVILIIIHVLHLSRATKIQYFLVPGMSIGLCVGDDFSRSMCIGDSGCGNSSDVLQQSAFYSPERKDKQ